MPIFVPVNGSDDAIGGHYFLTQRSIARPNAARQAPWPHWQSGPELGPGRHAFRDGLLQGKADFYQGEKVMANNSTLSAGECLNVRDALWSDNGTYAAVMQPNGNFVVLQGSTLLWATNTSMGTQGTDQYWINVSGVPLVRFTGQIHDWSSSISPDASDLGLAIQSLSVTITTGSDDLRGGNGPNDNADVLLLLQSGNTLRFPNINQSQNWPKNSTNTVPLLLPAGTVIGDIISFTLHTQFGGGIGGDNWDVNQIILAAQILGPSYYFATMQTDGNFVLYRGTPQQQGPAYWNSGTFGPSPLPFFITMQNDGNLVIYKGSAIWATNTNVTTAPLPFAAANRSTLAAGESLTVNDFLRSDNGGYTAIMQDDGDFVIWQGTTLVWHSNTSLGQGDYFATMQTDGNFVLYRGTPQQQGPAYWNSGTFGPSPLPFYLTMQNDGNLVIYKGSAIWSATPQSRYLGLNEEQQQQSSWCWAATTVSIARYYDSRTTWTQCTLANHVFSQTTCCADGGSPQCNRGSDPGADLATVGHLASSSNGPATFETIMSEINASRPIATIIQWNGSGDQHAPVIDGYDNTNPAMPCIEIQDPTFGASTQDFSTFPSKYHGGATWLFTYFSK